MKSLFTFLSSAFIPFKIPLNPLNPTKPKWLYFNFGEDQANLYKDGRGDWLGRLGADNGPPLPSNPHICNTIRRIRASCNFCDFRSGFTILFCLLFSHNGAIENRRSET